MSTKLNRSHCHRRAGADPAHHGPHGDRHAAPARSSSRVEDTVCAVHASAAAEADGDLLSRGGHRQPWRRPVLGSEALRTGRLSSVTTTGSATTSPRTMQGLPGLQPQGPPGGRLCPAAPAAGLADLPDGDRQGPVTVNELEARGPAGPAAAADRPLPRPVQHHHLQPQRQVPRRQEGPARALRQPGGPGRNWESRTAASWMSTAKPGQLRRPCPAAVPCDRLPDGEGVRKRRTSRKPTFWCRWKPLRRKATPPSPNPSSSVWKPGRRKRRPRESDKETAAARRPRGPVRRCWKGAPMNVRLNALSISN